MAHSRRLRARSGAIGLLGVCWCLARLASLVGCGAKHAGFDADDAGIASPTTEDDASTPSNEPLDGGAIGFAGDDATTHLDAGGGLCAVGTAGSFAMAGTLNLFGATVYYDDGGALPPGHYRIAYVDGCMQYGQGQNWTCNGARWLNDGWYLVGSTTDDHVLEAPCTWWQSPLSTDGTFATFDDCVDANTAVPPVDFDFDFDGGPLGLWLSDYPYDDNTPGVNGRNPKWQLTSQSHDYRSSRRDSEHRIVVHVDSDGQRRILGDGVG